MHRAGDGRERGGVNWFSTPPRSPEQEASPREEVVQAPPAFQAAPSTTCRRPTSGRRRPTSTWSATTMTPAASEDGDGQGIDGRGRSAREAFFYFRFIC